MQIENEPPRIQVNPSRRVTIDLAAAVTGLSLHGIRGKIRDGVWLEGHEYHRAPDGRVYVDLEGYEQWVATGRASR